MDKKYIPILIVLITAFFLWKMIVYGFIPIANDLVAHKPIAKWIETVTESSDEFPQWFPNLFSGMPSYGGYIYTPGDPTKTREGVTLGKIIKNFTTDLIETLFPRVKTHLFIIAEKPDKFGINK